MTGNRGPGDPEDPTGGPRRIDDVSDGWGTETLVMTDQAEPTADGEADDWEDEELVTASQYFSDDEIAAIEEAKPTAPPPPPPPPDGPRPGRMERTDAGLDETMQTMPSEPPVPLDIDEIDEPTRPGPAGYEVSEEMPEFEDPPTHFGEPQGAPTVQPGELEEMIGHVDDEPTPVPEPPPARKTQPSRREERAAPKQPTRSIPPPPFATPSMMPPPKAYDDESPALESYQTFRRETHRLARTRDFRSIATLHESALSRTPWAESEDVHINLLVDLAKLYRDRLSDLARAQATFERLIQRRPGHNEAMDFLKEAYELTGDMRSLHDLYARAVDEEWGPDRRVELTRSAARIALDHLGDPALAARDWERLLELGDMDGQVTVELSQVYREAERWADLGEFLENRAKACAGTTRVAILREAVEAFLSGAHNPERAEALITQVLDESPDDAIALASLANVRAQQKRWDELEQVGKSPMADAPPAAKLDVLRLVADLLSTAGEHDRAALSYERILSVAPGDRKAVAAREDYLRRKGNHQGLVSFLISRADKARTSEEKAKLYQRAAEVADKELSDAEVAAELWQKSVSAEPDNRKAYDALVALYDRLNNVEGVTQALEGLASITREPKTRAAVMRRLGDHYAYRADNDDNAQRCWLEVTAILPDDLGVQKELNGIHRRRGDFAALDVALTRQLWRTTETEPAVEVAREVAINLDENLSEPSKTVRAWLHVLDLAPGADDALEVLSGKLIARKETTEVQAVLETRLWRAVSDDDTATKVDIGLQIARNWEERDDRLAALSAYERVRAWAPADDRVLEGLVRLNARDNPPAAVSALEIASATSGDGSNAREILSRALPLIPEDQSRPRFFWLHRLLRFDAGDGLGAVVEAATTAEAWKELAALYERLAESVESPEMRRAFRIHLARVCEDNLQDPHRAFIGLQSLALATATDDDRIALTRLAEATGRWEDLLAVLDAAMGPGTPRTTRQELLRQRAEICETRIGDPQRAFLEYQRLVEGHEQGELDEVEVQALEQMHRLAVAHGFLGELEAIYGELWDRATGDGARVQVARARQAIRRDHLNDPAGALEQALLVVRLLPGDEAAANAVLEAAGTLNLWTRALPVLEGVWRAHDDTIEKLVLLAKLYHENCGDTGRATELLAEVLRRAPDNDEALAMLEAMGEQGGRWPRVVLAIRLAAARAAGSQRGLELARKVAAMYGERLDDRTASLEVHRWILQVWPAEVDSLETVIQAHREEGGHADLRARLEQWVERVSDTSRHVERWLEIGRLCREHLDDAAGALVAYSNVIELDPSNDEAAEAMRALGEVSLPTALRRKQVRVELARATGQRREDLLAQLAELEQEMGESDAAIVALRELFGLDEGAARALEPLTSLLREEQRWEELATLEEEAAGKTVDDDAKRAHLQAALRVTEDHLEDNERLERLLRGVLTLAPSNSDAFVRLTRLLRNAGRYEELVAELGNRTAEHAAFHDEHELMWMRRERVRVMHHALDQTKEAEALLRERPDKTAKVDPDDALWLAVLAAGRDDHAMYLEQRRRHLSKLPKRLGALVVCHLAEHCDQYMKLKGRVLALYREARTIDPKNTLASDALRGLGRGVKTWRSTSALLPVPSEEGLTNEDRAARLFRLGEQSKDTDVNEALGWYERAVAVNPNHVDAWDALTAIGIERHDHEYAYLAALEAACAYERVTAPSPEEVVNHAQRLARTANVARMADSAAEAKALSMVAFSMDSNVASAAILVADARFEAGAPEQSASLYSRILEQLGTELTVKERAHVLHRRAAIALKEGSVDAAHDDLREALAAAPLFPPALGAMSAVLREQGHPVNAALHELKALLVTRDASKRGPICRRIGDLCDSELKRPDEAGAWFELAVEAGVEDKVLMRRLLEHFRRTDRSQQALIAIGELIESTADPMELADLWATRGSILAERDLDAAEEALDIALSFNPAHSAALAHLCEVLEQRGDYEQLVALLDARTETGSPEERAEALEGLARMCFEKLGDVARGEEYLQRLVEIAPSQQALDQLLEIVRQDASRQEELLPLLARLMGTGGPFCDRIREAAQLIHAGGNHHWAWAVLSALMGAAPIDAWTKSTLAELRKQYERFDSLNLLQPFLIGAFATTAEPEPFGEALGELCGRVFLRSDEGAGMVVDGRTGPGKVFERVVEQLGVEGALVRSPDGTPPASVLSGAVPTVVVRTDLLAASPGELAYIYARGLMLARPECVALASVPEDDRHRLIPAIAAAVNEADALVDDPATAALSSAFAGKMSVDDLAAWKEHLEDRDKATAKAALLFEELESSAMRVGLIAAGDARTAIRAIARLTPEATRPPGVARLEDFEVFYTSIPILAPLFAFVASEDFGRVIGASA